jgi:pyruvate dehydrogenase E2 component (dihydrolipoamide acetyltransferase)
MSKTENITVPDIGGFEAVDVIEVLVSPGDRVALDDGLITLESDKASMDVPSPRAGVVKEVKVEAGGKVSQGDVIAVLEVDDEAADLKRPSSASAGEGEGAAEPKEEAPEEEAAMRKSAGRAPRKAEGAPGEVAAAPRLHRDGELPTLDEPIDERIFARAYASPAVRRFARELGVDLSHVEGSGRGGRILREDVQSYVQSRLAAPAAGVPEIDFSQWGEVERSELSRVQLLTGRSTHRSWITIPHVTQHDEADVTELEAFRKGLAKEAEAKGVKMTPIPFLIRAAVAALRELPRFNASLSADGEALVLKRYFHVGVAVDTGGGLVVPVVRDADRKGLFELAEEVADLAARARERKLKMEEMQGGCFTISSLGGIGGTGFTPIVNWPEVAILGVSRTEWRPRWNGEEFEPRQMMPLSLSYDHRVIDGAAAARFTRFLAEVLGDVRRLLL